MFLGFLRGLSRRMLRVARRNYENRYQHGQRPGLTLRVRDTMTEQDDRIEALLRARRIQPTPDDGFSARVVAQLPSRRLGPRWTVPALSSVGALITALIVPWDQVSSALVEVTQPQIFLAVALTVTVLVWSGSA